MGENEIGDMNAGQQKKSNTIKFLLGALVLIILIGLGVWRTCSLSSLDVSNPFIGCLRDYYSDLSSNSTNAGVFWADGNLKTTGEVSAVKGGVFELFPYTVSDVTGTNQAASKKVFYSITVIEGDKNTSYLNEAFMKEGAGGVKIVDIVNLYKGQALGKK
ncbi:MAG: hypothetical protein A2Y33_00435 [Spirochaetes bacterium GWF1_51_8]|nr:MAG: hypothetical protein A2Y33_00435 [Spirochaetes bacterium GWF1_51_8]